jgi:hypothetical protein
VPPQYPGDEAFKVFGIGIKSHKQQLEYLAKQSEIDKNNAAAGASKANTEKTLFETAQMKQFGGMNPAMADSRYRSVVQKQQLKQPVSPDELAFKAAYEKQKTLVPAATINMQGGLLSQEAKDMAAKMYEQTGQLPTGMRSPGMSAGILNTAAANSPEANIAANKATYAANADSLKAIQKNFDAVTAFEKTANKNLDLFLDQAKKVIDAGSPLINRPLRMISTAMGGTDQPAYETARRIAINEIAKVTSSPGLTGVLSDSARHEVESFNPNNATLAQTYRVANVLRQDMANRHQAYEEQISSIKGRMGGQPGTPAASSGVMYARDPQGKLHQAPAGSVLPAGWTLEKK